MVSFWKSSSLDALKRSADSSYEAFREGLGAALFRRVDLFVRFVRTFSKFSAMVYDGPGYRSYYPNEGEGNRAISVHT